MKLKVLSDFRKFKAGEEFEFKTSVTVIVGENGCGKSSLLHTIRGKYDRQNFDSKLHLMDFAKLSEHVELETDIKNFFFFDSVKDDGSNMHNSADASAFIANGGFQTQRLSHGETQLFYLNRLVSDIMKFRETSTDRAMVILDEFDKGFSLVNQSKVFNILHNISHKFNCQIICISHNYLLIDKIGLVYDLETREYVLSDEYLTKFK